MPYNKLVFTVLHTKLYYIQGDTVVFRAHYDVMLGASKHRFSLRPFSKPT
jgi:hypothetical protein